MKKILNILVIIVFLISFIGIQINKHYSHGELYSVAIYHEANSCCSDMKACGKIKMASNHCEHEVGNDFACENITELFKLIDVFIGEKISIPEVNSFDIFTTVLFEIIETNLNSTFLRQTIFYYLPPPLEKEFQAEFGVFLC